MNFIARVVSLLLLQSLSQAQGRQSLETSSRIPQSQNSNVAMTSGPRWDLLYQKVESRIPLVISGRATCSGALLEKDLVLTASHCVDRLRPIFVYFNRNEKLRYRAELLIFNRNEDLALIRLDRAADFEPLALLAEGAELQEGQPVVTIGHPVSPAHFKVQSVLKSDYVNVISSGIVSRVGSGGFVSDMSVSPGNSGGPVFNSAGDVVGVVSKKRIDRFVGDLAYFSSHRQIHKLRQELRAKGPTNYSVQYASTEASLYLLYSNPSYRKDQDGDSKSYYNLGLSLDVWDRLYVFLDTNLDTKEAFTQYGVGWNFFLQAHDPLQHYRLIPTVETLKFRFDEGGREVERQALGLGLILKASWFPIFVKGSTFRIQDRTHSLFGIGLSF